MGVTSAAVAQSHLPEIEGFQVVGFACRNAKDAMMNDEPMVRIVNARDVRRDEKVPMKMLQWKTVVTSSDETVCEKIVDEVEVVDEVVVVVVVVEKVVVVVGKVGVDDVVVVVVSDERYDGRVIELEAVIATEDANAATKMAAAVAAIVVEYVAAVAV